MFLLHEPLWWVFISGAIGYFCGWGKGRPGAGLLLGLFLGPLGCLAIMLLPPAARRPRGAGGIFGGPNAGTASGPFSGSSTGSFTGSAGPFGSQSQERPALGPTCPRCQKPVARSARACPHCGNVLMPIRYAVE